MPLLISSIIPLLILGPFFPDLVVSISSIVFLYYIFKNKEFEYFKKKPVIIFFLFCLYCILCTLLSDDILLSAESSLFYFRIGVFSCLIWYLLDKYDSFPKYFYYSLIICFSILIIDGFYQFQFKENLLGMTNKGSRVSSFFGDELVLGSYLSRLFPLLFALFLIKKKSKFESYFIGILFILIDVLIYISGERTAFIFLNLSTIFIIILIKEYQKFRLITFITAFIIILTLTFTNTEHKERMVTDTIESMGISSTSEKKFFFTPGHDNLIRVAFNMFLDKPIIGHGPKMFRIKCSDEKYVVGKNPCNTHPHNFYVQLLAETGIIGFLFLFSALFYVVFASISQLKSILTKKKRYLSDYQVCLLSGILITVWPLSPNGNFFNNWLAIVYTLPVGFYLHSFFGKNKAKIKIL